MKTDLFQSYGHCWISQICWHIKCSTLLASSFMILNSSAGIPSPPLALFVITLSKALLTSYCKMSHSRRVTTPSWLSGSLRPFLYSFPVYSCHLFLIPSASVRSLPFLSFIVPILAWNIPFISPIFLRSLSFPLCCFPLFLWIVHLGRPFYLSLLFSRTLHGSRSVMLASPSCLTLCYPMDCSCQALLSRRLSRQEYWSG